MNNNKIAMVETNQGLMLLEDYLDIKAIQYGFDSYADMRTCGCYIDTPPVVEISVKEQDELIPVFADASAKRIVDCLSDSKKDEVYRLLLAEHIREDVRLLIGQIKECQPMTDKEKDNFIDNISHTYVYEGKYDCNQSYWCNIQTLINDAVDGLKKKKSVSIPNIKINKYSANGLNLINVETDRSITNGILRFTHEITLTLQDDTNLLFYSVYCCGVSEILWSEDEEYSFEEAYPGLISEVREAIRAIE